jgi:hypothetical protein
MSLWKVRLTLNYMVPLHSWKFLIYLMRCVRLPSTEHMNANATCTSLSLIKTFPNSWSPCCLVISLQCEWWTIHHLIKSIQTSLCSSKLKPRCHYDQTYWYKRRQRAACCSLLSSTSSMDSSGELNDFECGLVIGCHISEKSVRDTATAKVDGWWRDCEVETSRHNHNETTTGYAVYNDWQGISSVEEGGSWNLPDIEWNNHPWVPQCYELASTMNVFWELRGKGFHGRAAAHKPNISSVNAKRCLKWCKERHHWTVHWKCDLGWRITLYHVAVQWEGLGVANACRTIPASMCSANSEIWRRLH